MSYRLPQNRTLGLSLATIPRSQTLLQGQQRLTTFPTMLVLLSMPHRFRSLRLVLRWSRPWTRCTMT